MSSSLRVARMKFARADINRLPQRGETMTKIVYYVTEDGMVGGLDPHRLYDSVPRGPGEDVPFEPGNRVRHIDTGDLAVWAGPYDNPDEAHAWADSNGQGDVWAISQDISIVDVTALPVARSGPV